MSELKLVELKTPRNDIADEIVEALTKFLEAAKKGEFDGIAVGASKIDGSYKTWFTKSLNFPALLAAVTTVQYRMLATRQDVKEDDD